MRISDWSSDVCASDLPGFRTGECIWSCHPATVKRLRDHLACLIDRLDGEEAVWIRAHRHDEHGTPDRVTWIGQISIAGIDRDRCGPGIVAVSVTVRCDFVGLE